MDRELEICAETLQACAAAEEGGADRIELCAALAEGGVTPARGFVREVVAAVSLPVYVLLRPRTGGFVYSQAEFRALCCDLEDVLAEGAAGVVAGVTTASTEPDRGRMAEIVRLSGGKPVTFHRAFDQLRDLPASLEMLIDLGCRRVLTSGGLPSVTDGLASLAALARQAAGRIRIAAGGGVTLQNAATLTAVPGLDVHASLRQKASPRTAGQDPLWQNQTGEISAESVRELRQIVHGQARTDIPGDKTFKEH